MLNVATFLKTAVHFERQMGCQSFCIELEADWLIILDEPHRKSPGFAQAVLQ